MTKSNGSRKQTPTAEQRRLKAQRAFIARVRSMNPDAVMSERLDRMEAELDRLEEGPRRPVVA